MEKSTSIKIRMETAYKIRDNGGTLRSKVFRVCKVCGNGALISKDNYRDTCSKCSRHPKGVATWNKGLKNPYSKKTIKKMSESAKIRLSNPKNHWNWQGGKTSLYDKIRNSNENKEWKLEVMQRDNFICQDCGSNISNTFEAHHKKTFSKILKEFLNFYNQFSPLEDKETLVRLSFSWKDFWDINNGKTLCEKCHKLIRHNKVGE